MVAHGRKVKICSYSRLTRGHSLLCINRTELSYETLRTITLSKRVNRLVLTFVLRILCKFDASLICYQPWYLAHRVDLHNELKRLALGPEGPGKAAEIFLDSPVRAVDENKGIVTLESGETHQADLIIAADGIHVSLSHPSTNLYGPIDNIIPQSRIRESIFDPAKPKPTGTAAYRFVLDSSSVFGNLECLPMKAEDGRCRVIIGGSKRVVVYPCRDSTLLNFVCMHEAGHVGEMAEGISVAIHTTKLKRD